VVEDLAQVLARAKRDKLPMTVREVMNAADDEHIGVFVEFADGTQAACLLPVTMLTEENIRVSAAVMAVVWEMLKPPAPNPNKKKGKRVDEEEVIDLDGC
jgi:hypothetical protein